MIQDMTDDELVELAEQLGVSVEEVPDILSDLEESEYSESQKDIEHAVYLDENGLDGFDQDSGEFY